MHDHVGEADGRVEPADDGTVDDGWLVLVLPLLESEDIDGAVAVWLGILLGEVVLGEIVAYAEDDEGHFPTVH
jgi:hypothetical protein